MDRMIVHNATDLILNGLQITEYDASCKDCISTKENCGCESLKCPYWVVRFKEISGTNKSLIFRGISDCVDIAFSKFDLSAYVDINNAYASFVNENNGLDNRYDKIYPLSWLSDILNELYGDDYFTIIEPDIRQKQDVYFYVNRLNHSIQLIFTCSQISEIRDQNLIKTAIAQQIADKKITPLVETYLFLKRQLIESEK